MAGSFPLLIQLVSSQEPQLLFATSWILSLKKDRLAFLTEFLSRDLLQSSNYHCLECLEILDLFAFFVQARSMIDLSRLTAHSISSVSTMLDVFKCLKFEIMSWMKAVSCSLFGAKVSFNVCIIFSVIGILMIRGVWSEDNGRMVWWSSLEDLLQRNMRSMTEFDSPAMSEYLVRPGLVGEERARSKESAMIIRSSLVEEWKGKEWSQRLSLMLKSSVIKTTLSMLTSVSFRYFKAVCDESE